MGTPARFGVGDIVKHRASFLKSVGWYTDVPRDGIVRGLSEQLQTDGVPFPRVQWCDRPEDTDGTLINPHNIMPAKSPDYSGL